MKSGHTSKTIIVIIVLIVAFVMLSNRFQAQPEEGFPSFADKVCDVAGIEILGDILTYEYFDPEASEVITTSTYVNALLEEAEYLRHIGAVLLEIDSFGGLPVASQEIVETIQNRVSIPVVVRIRSAADSGAYWVASAADRIFASELSEIGSIGVTQSYVDESEANRLQGFTFNELNTAKFKDTGHPAKPLNEEEKALIQRDLDIMHEFFVRAVAKNRNLSVERGSDLADGSVMLGRMAKEVGLIDEIGGEKEVKQYLGQILNIQEPVICW